MFCICFSGKLSSGQSASDTNHAEMPWLWFNAGLLTFVSFEDNESDSGSSHSYSSTEIDKQIGPGFSAGIHFSTHNDQHFSFFPEFQYIFNYQNVKYSSNSSNFFGSSSSKVYADYALYISSVNILMTSKFTFGNKTKFYFGTGIFSLNPIWHRVNGQKETYSRYVKLNYINDSTYIPVVETSYSIQKDEEIDIEFNSSIGMFFCSGFYIPKEKNSIGFEIRVNYSWQGQRHYFHMPYMFGSLNLTYQLNQIGKYM